MSSYEHSEKRLDTADEIQIYVQSWTPSKNPKAQVLMVHGYLEHGGRYEEFGQYLAENGIEAIVYDCRGHGKSSGTKAHVSSYTQYHEDLRTVLNDLDRSLPIFILAHSNGGLIAIDHYLVEKDKLDKEIKGYIFSSPFLGPADELPYIKVLASKVLGTIFPRLTMPASEVTSEILTHDVDKRALHDEDALVLDSFTVGWAKQSMATQARVVKKCKDFGVPVFFVYAEEDQVADPKLNKSFAEQIVTSDKTVVERKGNYHEVLNETDRKELYTDIKRWIETRV